MAGIKKGFPYKLYYDEDFDCDQPQVKFKPASGDPEREARVRLRVDQVKISLERDGQTNPVVVYIKKSNQNWKLHPGKCRVTALRELGMPVKAIIIDKCDDYCGDLPEISPTEASALFSDDIEVVWNKHKFCPRLRKPKFEGEPMYPGEYHVSRTDQEC
jgi:hypothetical protein